MQKLAEKAHERSQTPPNTLQFDSSRGRLVLNLTRPGDLHVASKAAIAANVLDIDPAELRRRSKDAWSTSAARHILDGEDLSGKTLEAASADVVLPTKINRKGNYGFEVQWADGLRGSIYGFVLRCRFHLSE